MGDMYGMCYESAGLARLGGLTPVVDGDEALWAEMAGWSGEVGQEAAEEGGAPAQALDWVALEELKALLEPAPKRAATPPAAAGAADAAGGARARVFKKRRSAPALGANYVVNPLQLVDDPFPSLPSAARSVSPSFSLLCGPDDNLSLGGPIDASLLSDPEVSVSPSASELASPVLRRGSLPKTRGRKPSLIPDSTKHFACEYCDRRFKRQEHLKRHIRSLHLCAKPYGCHVCGKVFSRSDNLNQHLKTHK